MPVAVPPLAPQLSPVLAPQFVPQAVPNAVPVKVPRPTPIAQPVKVPPLSGPRSPVPVGTAAPGGESPGTVTAGTSGQRPSIIVPLLGRQPAHALHVHRADETASRLTCLASGFGWRRTDDGTAEGRRVGLAPILYTTDMILHDLPANHPRHAECLIVVDRRYED